MPLTDNAKEAVFEKVQSLISILLQLAILIVSVVSLSEEQWLVAFTGLVVLAITFGPAFIERQFNVHIPIEFTLATCVFLWLSYGLGEVSQFYQKIWWWDLMLHSFSALVMGLIGFLLIYMFHMTNRIDIKPIFVAIGSFGFAVTLGTLWEVFEFLIDWSFGFNMQKSGLLDTMTDLLVDIAGAVFAAFMGYKYVKGEDSLLADDVIRHFLHANPQFVARIQNKIDRAP